MKPWIFLVWAGLCLLPMIARGAVLFPLQGTVANFDDKKVILNVGNGKVEVERRAFGALALRPGQRIDITIDPKMILVPAGSRISKPN